MSALRGGGLHPGVQAGALKPGLYIDVCACVALVFYRFGVFGMGRERRGSHAGSSANSLSRGLILRGMAIRKEGLA